MLTRGSQGRSTQASTPRQDEVFGEWEWEKWIQAGASLHSVSIETESSCSKYQEGLAQSTKTAGAWS